MQQHFYHVSDLSTCIIGLLCSGSTGLSFLLPKPHLLICHNLLFSCISRRIRFFHLVISIFLGWLCPCGLPHESQDQLLKFHYKQLVGVLTGITQNVCMHLGTSLYCRIFQSLNIVFLSTQFYLSLSYCYNFILFASSCIALFMTSSGMDRSSANGNSHFSGALLGSYL